jgi:hypothetical protein
LARRVLPTNRRFNFRLVSLKTCPIAQPIELGRRIRAAIYLLIGTAKLNCLGPETYLYNVLTGITDTRL